MYFMLMLYYMFKHKALLRNFLEVLGHADFCW